MLTHFSRITVFVLGAGYALIRPTVPFILVCLFAILLDAISAWRLARRVKENHNANDGKFKSEYLRRIFSTFLMICLVVVLCHFIDRYVITFVDMNLANVVSGAFCFVQLLSILENESSLNDASWAVQIQKILVDKAKRHFNIDFKDNTPKNQDHGNI
ncbi:MAG: phage holin family protein [Tannerellaceae bacterium]|nr:phage holin family protein [Tannerellaceae bacterium]